MRSTQHLLPLQVCSGKSFFEWPQRAHRKGAVFFFQPSGISPTAFPSCYQGANFYSHFKQKRKKRRKQEKEGKRKKNVKSKEKEKCLRVEARRQKCRSESKGIQSTALKRGASRGSFHGCRRLFLRRSTSLQPQTADGKRLLGIYHLLYFAAAIVSFSGSFLFKARLTRQKQVFYKVKASFTREKENLS